MADTETTFAARFAKQVADGPSRIAVKTAAEQVTYRELDRIANRVAWSVLHRAKGGLVAVVLEQGIRTIAAMVGVLKAGKAYVHLDPEALPQQVIERVLSRCEPYTIISDSGILPVTVHAEQRIEWPDIGRASCDEPHTRMSPDDVAQYLLTSGSTGEPKIIYRTQRTMLSSARSLTNYLHICPEDRLTLFATATGQASNVTFSALLNGASLHHFNVRQESFARIAARMLAEAITIYFSSVTLLRHFLKAVGIDQRFPDVRLVRLASEPAFRNDYEQCRQHFGEDCVVMNGLAASEAGVALEHYVDADMDMTSLHLPVGRPVDGVSVKIVDDAGRQVGVNEIGEIIIESAGVALGYWGHPDLTAAVFGQGTVSGVTRVCRTNDLGRMRPDGAIEHLGRKDQRIRIRGGWVDIGEVEQALMALPIVRAAAVAPWDDAEHRRLVAYVVPATGATLSTKDLRRRLEKTLAPQMLPAVYVAMERLPTNAGGKIDRSALPAPEHPAPPPDVPLRGPRTASERSIHQIWADVLGLESIDVRERFTDLGGDSLLAFRIVNRIHAAYGVNLPIPKLMQSATIEQMARIVEEHLPLRAASNDHIDTTSTQ